MKAIATSKPQKTNSYRIDFRFILIWVLMNYAGGYAASFLFRMIYGVIKPNAGSIDALKNSAIIIAVDIAVGIIQWLILRNRMSRSKGWIFLTAVGAIVGMAFVFFLFAAGIKIGDWMYGVLGLFIGFAQYQLLGRRVKRASIWILVSVLDGFLSQKIGQAAYSSQALGRIDLLAILIFLKVLVLFITGFTIIWLIHFPLTDRKTI